MQRGLGKERRGSEDVRIPLKRWAARCTVTHIEGILQIVAQTGAVVTGADRVRDRGGVKN